MKRTRWIVSVVIVFALFFSMTAFPPVVVSADNATNRASYYLSTYTASASRTGGSKTFYVNFSVSGTGIMDRIGATKIVVYRSPNMSNWFEYATYDSSDYPSMLVSSKAGYAEDIAVTGTYGYYYKAKVTIYAEKNGGSDSREIYTNSLYLTSSG